MNTVDISKRLRDYECFFSRLIFENAFVEVYLGTKLLFENYRLSFIHYLLISQCKANVSLSVKLI